MIGFENNWYSILVNGQSHGFFHSTRGVKQGDPLSPALFVLSAEVLSAAMNALFEEDSFRGYEMPKWSSKLNHLAYADDTIIFAFADKVSLQMSMKILKEYEEFSGQKFNTDKSSFFMHSKVAERREEVNIGLHGRRIAIPKIRVVWDSDIYMTFQKLCFAKLWWKLRTTGTLWSNFMWNKYCKRFRPTAVQWKGGSHTWKMMLQARDEIEQNIWWEPRNGTSSMWFDNWSKLGSFHDVFPAENDIGHDLEEFMIHYSWNFPKLQAVIPNNVVEYGKHELGYFVRSEKADKPSWKVTSSDNFTRIWFWKLPIDEVLMRMRINIASRCWCCLDQQETMDHVFVTGPFAKSIWRYVSAAAGIIGSYHQTKQAVLLWWNANYVSRLKPVYQAMPAFIIWQLWKSRNTRRHGGTISVNKVIHEVNSFNLYAKARRIIDSTNLVAEAITLKEVLKYCIAQDLLSLIMEIDSLIWRKFWMEYGRCLSIIMIVSSIQICMKNKDVMVKHVLREGTIEYDHFTDIPSQGRRLLNIDRSQMPNFRFRTASKL
ncbi:uncharacterized protein LOC132045634 [Lycium ferocissimum]|uniref:uncharacterized protein LOC132045634 n=1 Tax=Lycium ferocissimum TaxID=112874 RepID=UPI002814C7A8|nr:uncharacterized protein LOC132045634 [Lycium ferocissimum]